MRMDREEKSRDSPDEDEEQDRDKPGEIGNNRKKGLINVRQM